MDSFLLLSSTPERYRPAKTIAAPPGLYLAKNDDQGSIFVVAVLNVQKLEDLIPLLKPNFLHAWSHRGESSSIL